MKKKSNREKGLKRITLFILIVLSIICVATTYLIINYEETGSSKINSNYYEVVYSNVLIDYDTSMSIQLDNDEDKIVIKIPDLEEFRIKKEFSIDVQNIGNKNIIVSKMFLNNIQTSIDASKVNIDISLSEGSIIKGGETKKIIIGIKYTGNEILIGETANCNFNINYTFKETKL